ncbi:hypothetical protein [Massilia aquatica]|uniref:Uncharacterized protein n=1 Tax=Massilia aquatica TaxID=2609000 RepID=A0ABX0M6F0_9BURK|nr:hypothetical protein [Massilia aquatica]NHZ42764.1 hypothetical protein [Massilia aquatica]
MKDDADCALHFDMNDESINAIDAYEKKIADKTAQLADYINLMAVYFVIQDYGYNVDLDIPEHYFDVGLTRIREIPAQIKERLGESDEANFWRDYALFIVLDSPVDEAVWIRYIQSGSTLVPLIAIGLHRSEGEFAAKTAELARSIANEDTCRTRYIESILSSGRAMLD